MRLRVAFVSFLYILLSLTPINTSILCKKKELIAESNLFLHLISVIKKCYKYLYKLFMSKLNKKIIYILYSEVRDNQEELLFKQNKERRDNKRLEK